VTARRRPWYEYVLIGAALVAGVAILGLVALIVFFMLIYGW